MTEQHPFHKIFPQQVLPLRRRALKLTANEHWAEDLVQDTLLKAWAKRDSYRDSCRDDTRLRAWLFTILRNTFYSQLRKRRFEVEDIDGCLADTLYEEPRQDHAFALQQLMAAIALLPKSQGRPLVLMGVYGYSQLEAADACRCTVGTVKSRVSRGRATLSRNMPHVEVVVQHAQMPRTGVTARSTEPLRNSSVPDLVDARAGSH